MQVSVGRADGDVCRREDAEEKVALKEAALEQAEREEGEEVNAQPYAEVESELAVDLHAVSCRPAHDHALRADVG